MGNKVLKVIFLVLGNPLWVWLVGYGWLGIVGIVENGMLKHNYTYFEVLCFPQGQKMVENDPKLLKNCKISVMYNSRGYEVFQMALDGCI